MPSAEVTFIAGEYWPTQNGKDRWKLRANDGREFGVWSETVYQAVMQHLHEGLVADVSSKQSEQGTWWNTLHGVPALGVQADGPPKKNGGGGGGGASGVGLVDMAALVEPLNRIATAVENSLALLASNFLQARLSESAAASVTEQEQPPEDDGPQEP